MADIFADLLAQYLGSIAVVQPLLPSFFAPMPPLVSDATLFFSDEQVIAPPETDLFASEKFSVLEEERMTAQTNGDDNGSQQRLAFSSASASTSVPSMNISALPFQHDLHFPHSLQVRAEPDPLVENREASVEEETATSGLLFVSSNTVQTPLRGKPQHAAPLESEPQHAAPLESEPQPRFQRDGIARQDHQALLLRERVLEKDTSLPSLSERLLVSPSQPLSQVSVQQPASWVQPRPQTASPTASKSEDDAVRRPLDKVAEQKTLLRGRQISASSPITPFPGSELSFQVMPLSSPESSLSAVSPSGSRLSFQATSPADPESSLPASPQAFTQEETPGAVTHLADATLQVQTRETLVKERRAEQTFSQAQRPIVARNEQSVAQVSPGQGEEEQETLPVRIHIGRVVVRGATGAPHSISTPPAKRMLRPALSLNEYLKQRERGNR
jgi:hypothetical protein